MGSIGAAIPAHRLSHQQILGHTRILCLALAESKIQGIRGLMRDKKYSKDLIFTLKHLVVFLAMTLVSELACHRLGACSSWLSSLHYRFTFCSMHWEDAKTLKANSLTRSLKWVSSLTMIVVLKQKIKNSFTHNYQSCFWILTKLTFWQTTKIVCILLLHLLWSKLMGEPKDFSQMI